MVGVGGSHSPYSHKILRPLGDVPLSISATPLQTDGSEGRFSPPPSARGRAEQGEPFIQALSKVFWKTKRKGGYM